MKPRPLFGFALQEGSAIGSSTFPRQRVSNVIASDSASGNVGNNRQTG
jgi:hypothetical protein